MKMMNKEEMIMKKVLFIVAVATLFFSCNKEIEPTAPTTPSTDRFTFKASIEQFSDPTKATINADNQLVWATGDKIGVYVNDASWTDKNQPFTLSDGAGSTNGTFAWDYTGDFSDKAAAAFFPWDDNDNADDGTRNNVYDGYAYFSLHEGIYSYSSGKMLTPLVASLSGSTDDIIFKHAGAAVKVHINNVPKHVHSIGMSVDGQQVTGEYKVSVANAGNEAMTLVSTADATKNTVWINIWNGSEAAWDFIFPIPEVTKPKLSFQMYDDNDVLVWSKKLKAQSSDLKRGDILVMPPIDITPYSQFTESTEWTLCGKICGNAAWDADIPMYTDGTVTILKGMTFKAGDAFKIRKNKAWAEAYPSSDYAITQDCTMDVWFNNTTHEITLKEAKCDYPAPKVTLYFGINGSIPHGVAISSSTLAPGHSWPGLELTEREYINGKWYYKHVVDGPTVWGKSLSASIVSIDSWNTSSSTLTFDTIKTEYYFEATASTAIEQLDARPEEAVTTGITIDGDMSDWTSILPLGSSGTSRIRDWKFSSDNDNLYFYLVLRKNKMRTAYNLLLGFDYDETGSQSDGNNLKGCEIMAIFQPFTNETGGTPTCVNGTINTATINGTEISDAGIQVYGLDPDSSATGDSADYYLEVSVPKSILSGLPSSGSINIAASYEYYTTGLCAVTL